MVWALARTMNVHEYMRMYMYMSYMYMSTCACACTCACCHMSTCHLLLPPEIAPARVVETMAERKMLPKGEVFQ